MTYETDAVIVTLAHRASTQVREGLAALQAGQILEAEVHFRAAHATLSSLALLLEKPQPPIRNLCVVVGPSREEEDRPPDVREYEEEPLPRWMETKKGGPDGSAA